MIDFTHNHFELFGLPMHFRVDGNVLDSRYGELQRDVHPDRFAGGDDAQQRLAMQAAARVNEAYRTLRNPVDRGRYMLLLSGIDALAETDTALALAFLERQLERRERAAEAFEAGDVMALEGIVDEIRDESKRREHDLAARFDAHDVEAARTDVRELKFLQKVAEDVVAMIEMADG